MSEIDVFHDIVLEVKTPLEHSQIPEHSQIKLQMISKYKLYTNKLK